ncbi:hypothetical protein [Nonomuraea sp. WAC 01424]|uniref:hypothetical protein n=1 Tax=Nonomuraea sp. WAC 01424 TaxID=2203200 RepID=UPI000F79033B|nr:hypothetical protein [Nonomuraea sp. WAC 01424]
MWIRGTARTFAVALLGIQITIIALASAASATSHPSGGERVQAPTPFTRPDGTEGLLDLPLRIPEGTDRPWTNVRQAAVEAALAEMYRLKPGLAWPGTDIGEAHGRFTVTQEHQAVPGRPATAGSPFPADESEESEESEDAWAAWDEAADAWVETGEEYAERSSTQDRAERSEAVTRPASVGEGMMPRSRAQRAQKRSQLDLARVLPRQAAMHMTHATATRWLKSSGLRTKSSGHCTSRYLHHCTSLDSVRAGTIARVIDLKHDSGCPVMVTGGTETGHAPGLYSHGNGYKLDITHNACIDRYITRHHQRTGVRGDGSALYRSASGTVFADESSHWDILFK